MTRSFLVVLTITSLASAIGCSTATLTPAAQVDSGPPACTSEPQLACDAGAPVASPTSCLADPNASGWAGHIPADAGYPLGCAAYFAAADCSNLGRCVCLLDADAGHAAWSCPQ